MGIIVEVGSAAVPATPAPASAPGEGFRATASGLIVPEELSRTREVWTFDEWRQIERTTKLLESRGMEFFLRCGPCTARAARRGQAPPKLERIRRADGALTLRCDCTEREFRPKGK
jgi:hypothetical protein